MPVPEGTEPQPLTDAGADSLIGFIEDAITQTFDDTAYQLTDLPGFVADTNPVGPFANVSRQVTRQACQSYARGGGPQNLPGFDALWGGICGPYLESIDEAPSPGFAGLPFTGGQCAGALYRILFQWTNDQGSRQSLEQEVPARVTGTYTEAGNFGSKRVGYVITPPGGSAQRFLQATVTDPNTNPAPSVQVLFRIGGQPDDCGDPPPIYDPPKIKPGLPDLPPTTPIDIPGIGPVNVGVSFNPEGTINVSLPDVGVEVDVPIDFGNDGDGAGAGGGAGDPPPGDVGTPGAGVAVGAGGEAEGEAPPGSVLTGVRVQITAFPNSRSKYTEDVFRGAYYVYMGVPTLLDLDFGGAMVRQDQFFFAEKENLTKWRVSANTGYELITTPYYREVEAA